MKTTEFRRQHAEIMAIAQTILKLMVDLPNDKSCVKEINKNLLNFAGKLKVHLATEDAVLYPALLNSPDPRVVAITRQYQQEMGGLKDDLAKYMKKWQIPNYIEKDVPTFTEQTKKLFALLTKRVTRENNELYVMAEKL